VRQLEARKAPPLQIRPATAGPELLSSVRWWAN